MTNDISNIFMYFALISLLDDIDLIFRKHVLFPLKDDSDLALGAEPVL